MRNEVKQKFKMHAVSVPVDRGAHFSGVIDLAMKLKHCSAASGHWAWSPRSCLPTSAAGGRGIPTMGVRQWQ